MNRVAKRKEAGSRPFACGIPVQETGVTAVIFVGTPKQKLPSGPVKTDAVRVPDVPSSIAS